MVGFNKTIFGDLTGVTPNGRLAWMPLSDGKMICESMNIGIVHNFKILSGLLDTPEGEKDIITLLLINSIIGNGKMQFSYIDNEVLKKIQKGTRKVGDLIISVLEYT